LTLPATVNNVPTQPGAITGNAIICTGSSNTYSIAAVSGATSYTWTLPSGWTGTSTTTSITTTASATSGNITVSANNICGSSALQTIAVAVPVPAKPVIIVNNTNSVTPILSTSGGTSYQWFRNGIAISGAIYSTFPVTEGGSYTVQAIVSDCAGLMSDPQVLIITGDDSIDRLGNHFNMYPNPATGTLVISLGSFNAAQDVIITVSDVLGHAVEKTTGIGGTEKELNVHSYASGQYIIIIQQGQEQVRALFIKAN